MAPHSRPLVDPLFCLSPLVPQSRSRSMRSDRTQRWRNLAICVAAALAAIAPASTVRASDCDDLARMGAMSDPAAVPLQLGVGQSVIRDLPEEAGEIYV